MRRLRLAVHELRCRDCRVTWTGLLWRLLTGYPVAYWGERVDRQDRA